MKRAFLISSMIPLALTVACQPRKSASQIDSGKPDVEATSRADDRTIRPTAESPAAQAAIMAAEPVPSSIVTYQERRKQFRTLCETLDSAQTRDIYNQIARIDRSSQADPLGFSELDFLMRHLGEVDSQNAFSFKPEGNLFICGTATPDWAYALSGIARRNGPQAFEIWKERNSYFHKPPRIEETAQLLMEGWAAGNPGEAREALKKPEFATCLAGCVAGYFKGLPDGTDWKAEAANIPSLSLIGNVSRERAIIQLTKRWVRANSLDAFDHYADDPAFGASLKSRQPGKWDPSLSEIISDWMWEDPQSALTWLQQWDAPPGKFRPYLGEDLAIFVLSKDRTNGHSLAGIWPLLTRPQLRERLFAADLDEYASHTFFSQSRITQLQTLLALPGLSPAQQQQAEDALQKERAKPEESAVVESPDHNSSLVVDPFAEEPAAVDPFASDPQPTD